MKDTKHNKIKSASSAGFKFALILLTILCIFNFTFTLDIGAATAKERSRGYGELPESKLFRKAQNFTPIQPLVDAVPPNGELKLEDKQYIGPLYINKPITISGLGDQTTIYLSSEENEEQSIIVQSDDIQLTNFTIVDERKQPQRAVITAEGHSNVLLQQLNIQTRARAIEMLNMKQSKLLHNVVAWNGDSFTKQTSRGNGVFIYESSDIVVEGNTISEVYDGVYVENSDHLTIRQNKVTDSRYGYHMMYSERIEIAENESHNNVIGLMIMTSNDITLEQNQLSGHQANANASAILIYDVFNAKIFANFISNNRIGLTIERSQQLEVINNELDHNFVALQLQSADELFLEQNNFIGNVSNVWDDGSTEPIIRHNYWDSLQGLDLDGDSYSELPYKSAPFFLSLIERRPSFQLLFGTPGVAFIEQMYQGDSKHWISDLAPRIKIQQVDQSFFQQGAVTKGVQWGMLLSWLLLTALAFYIIIKVRRYEQ